MTGPGLLFSVSENSHKRVLNAIRLRGELSGAELSRLTGLQPSTILYILRFLEKKGIIAYSRTGDSTSKGGKKPILLKIKAGIGMMLGVELLAHSLRYVVIDLAGNIFKKGEKPYTRALRNESIAGALAETLDDLMQLDAFSGHDFLGIGLGIPGLVDSHLGLVKYSALLEVSNMFLAGQLERLLGKPVFLINDANAGVLSIAWYHDGVGDELPDNIVYLTYNMGSKNLGTGLFIRQELYEGISGTAGEIISPLPGIGDLVHAAASRFGKEFPLLLNHTVPENVPFKVIFGYMQDSCKLSQYVVEKTCNLIAEEIIRITGLLNPSLIVLGGDITCEDELLSRCILPQILRKTGNLTKMGYELPSIRFSTFGEYSVAMGSTAMILSRMLKSQNHKPR